MAFRETALIANMPPKENKWHNGKATLIRILTEVTEYSAATPSCFLSAKRQTIFTAVSLAISTSWLQFYQSVEIVVNS